VSFPRNPTEGQLFHKNSTVYRFAGGRWKAVANSEVDPTQRIPQVFNNELQSLLFDSEVVAKRINPGLIELSDATDNIPGHNGVATNGNTTTNVSFFLKTSLDSETWRVTDFGTDNRSGIWNNVLDSGTQIENAYWAPGNTSVALTAGGTTYVDSLAVIDFGFGFVPTGSTTRLTYAQARVSFGLPANVNNEYDSDGVKDTNGDRVYARFNGTDSDGWLLVAIGDRDAPNAGQAVAFFRSAGTSATTPAVANLSVQAETETVGPVDQTLSQRGFYFFDSEVGDNGRWTFSDINIVD